MRIYITGLTVDNINYINSRTINIFKPNVLRAFDHIKGNKKLDELMNNKHLTKSLMLDSGTFVLNQLGKLENCKEYFNNYNEFLNMYKVYFNYYITFDAVFEGENAYSINKNYIEKLEENGHKPVFVIHSFNDYEIEYIINKKPELVAIASALLKNENEFNKLVKIVDRFYDKGIKVHLLGCSSYKHLTKAYRAWSCDASSYGRWAGFNRMIFYSENEGKEVTLCRSKETQKGELNKDYYLNDKMKSRLYEYEKFISPLFNIHEVVGNSQNLVMANAYYMYYLESKVNEFQKVNNVTFNEW